jgi:hypothetical protein
MEARPRSPLVPQSDLGPPRMWKRRDDGSPCGAPTSLGKGCAFPTFPHPFYWLKADISNWFKSGHFYFGLTLTMVPGITPYFLSEWLKSVY